MRPWCVPSLRSCGDERRAERNAERNAELHARLASGGYDRHAQRVYRSKCFGAERIEEQSVLRSRLRLSRTARRSAQVDLVGRNWTLVDGETLRAWPIHLAAGADWESIANCGATVDATRGNRLETSCADR